MTAASNNIPDAWKEVCLVSIYNGSSEIELAAITEDITAMDWGDKDIGGLSLLTGGRIVKWTPQADESITMKVYPVDAFVSGVTTAAGTAQLFHPQSTADSNQPIVVDNTRTRNKHKIVILTAETLPSSAGTVPTSGLSAQRIQVINAYMTKYAPSFDDKVWSAEISFKWTPFNKNGDANKREESTDGSADLPAITTATTSF